MSQASSHTIHRLLGSNNILLVVADGYNSTADNQSGHHLADLALKMATTLSCYAVINSKYKRQIIDLSDINALQTRAKVRDGFLLPIKKFKDEIATNGLPPLIIFLQPLYPANLPSEMLILGYGQGERVSQGRPHRPTISPSLLAKIRIAFEDQHISTALAPLDSSWCGRELHHLNQLFRQKNLCEGFHDPTVRSILVNVRPDVISQRHLAESLGVSMATALSQFTISMSLVRNIDINNIDVSSNEDLQYIFRLPGGEKYTDMLRDSYIDELAGSIDRNGLLHPLVLLKKHDGRYKILCGFRRFQALKRLNRPMVEAKVYQETDFSTEDFFNISLAENTKRRNLNPIEIGNFLDSAGSTLGLSNTELAEQFGGTLGIGKPGQKVSHTTIHKYRKVNQIRLRGESPEIISDVINEKLQFSIASEILAPIKNDTDRDNLYLQVIKPLAPTRPQLTEILSLLMTMAPSLSEALAMKHVQQALVNAGKSAHPVATLLKNLRKDTEPNLGVRSALFQSKVQSLRHKYFGEQSSKKDFNIVPATSSAGKEYIVHFRLKHGQTTETLNCLRSALEENDLFSFADDLDKA
jgi:hypothetical protein